MCDTVRVEIYLDKPTGATDRDVQAYVEFAILSERGQLHRSEPMSQLDRDSVVVMPPKRGRRRRRKEG